MTTKLYRVKSVYKKLKGFTNVPFYWFYGGRRTPARPYADLIANYGEDVEGDVLHRHRELSENAIDELFTEDEAKQLVAYLQHEEEDGDQATITVEEEPLPISNNSIPIAYAPCNRETGIVKLAENAGYSLPFKVAGRFNLADGELP